MNSILVVLRSKLEQRDWPPEGSITISEINKQTLGPRFGKSSLEILRQYFLIENNESALYPLTVYLAYRFGGETW